MSSTPFVCLQQVRCCSVRPAVSSGELEKTGVFRSEKAKARRRRNTLERGSGAVQSFATQLVVRFQHPRLATCSMPLRRGLSFVATGKMECKGVLGVVGAGRFCGGWRTRRHRGGVSERRSRSLTHPRCARMGFRMTAKGKRRAAKGYEVDSRVAGEALRASG